MTCTTQQRFARRARVVRCHPHPRCGQLRRPVLLPPTKIRSRSGRHFAPDGADTRLRRNR